jgi:choline dehydrogenase-like flavoprotein
VSEQKAFDADLGLAVSRREFLVGLGRASSAALMMGSSLGCAGNVQGRREARRLGDEAPIFDPVQREVIAKIIDGFNPPDTPLRVRLAAEDPGYDLVAAYSEFAWSHGDEFLSQMKFLVNFINVLPTFTPTFFSRLGLPGPFRLRAMHVDDANRFFLHLRDSGSRQMRNIFSGAKFIATSPLYTNERVAWRDMQYPGPWLLVPERPESDWARATSFDMAGETQENVAFLERNSVGLKNLREGLTAATVVPHPDRLVLETDIVVVGSGAGGAYAAEQLAKNTDQRVLVLENGEFIRPEEFLQRERFAMPRMFYTQFSVNKIFDQEVPTVSTAAVSGRLVGGSATINHALAFEPPKPVIREWHEVHGARFQYDDLQPHLDVIHRDLRIATVPESQISGSNLALKRGATALGLSHHGPAKRNAHQCIGCGFCDLGCRYNRKLTPLNVVLPEAARHGAQVLADCLVKTVIFEDLPEGGPRGESKRAIGVTAVMRDRRGVEKEEVEVRAKRVVLAAGPFGSPRILLRSGLPSVRRKAGRDPAAVGNRFSTHATITFYGEFDHAIYPSNAGPPMAYFAKKYELDDQSAADPERHHVRYALEGMLNHPIAFAQLMPYESAESYQTFMRRFNQTMTLAVMFRDRPVGNVTSHAFQYRLAEEDHAGWLDSLHTGARIMFAAGAKRVFFNAHRPLIVDSVDQIESVLTPELVRSERIQITSGHPMGGCALGADPKRDVVDSEGHSWDVAGLYVMDSSVFPTSLGVNPCLTTYALGRYMGRALADELRG